MSENLIIKDPVICSINLLNFSNCLNIFVPIECINEKSLTAKNKHFYKHNFKRLKIFYYLKKNRFMNNTFYLVILLSFHFIK